MKNIICLFTLCFIGAMAQAQSLTEKDLQGTWAIHSFYVSGITIDVATGDVTFSDELKTQMTPEIQEQVKGQMAGASTALKGGTIVVNGKDLTRTIAGTSKKGTYAFKEADGKQYLTITYEDGTTSEVGVAKKDNLLHISAQQNGQEAEFRYMKQ